MTSKKIIIGIAVIIVSVVLFGVYKLATFNLFDNQIQLIKEIDMKDKDYSIKIYYIPSDATLQSSIQVRLSEIGVEKVLEDYERYNYLEDFRIMPEDTLIISISDTTGVNKKQVKKLSLP